MAFIEIPWAQKPPMGVPLDPGNKLNENIFADFPLNEGGGNIVHDASGLGNNGVFSGDTSWVSEKFGHALVLDGANDYITIANSKDFAATGLTAIIWFKRTQSGVQVILSQQDGGGTGRNWLRLDTDNTFTTILGGVELDSNVVCLINTWYQGAVTYDAATDIIALYLNGNFLTSKIDAMESAAGDLLIGVSKTLAADFQGNIDNPVLYDRPLLREEITELYINSWQRYQPQIIPLGVAAPDVFVPQVIMI